VDRPFRGYDPLHLSSNAEHINMEWYLYPIHWHMLATEWIAKNPTKALYTALALIIAALVI
jgi:hypothetical protein